MNLDYEVKLVESTRELKGKELVKAKLFAEARPLADLVEELGSVTIDLDYIAKFDVHNEKSENKDYSVYLYADKDGTKYTTSSDNLYETAIDIYTDMSIEDEEWKLKVFGVKSKNFGGNFLTASLE